MKAADLTGAARRDLSSQRDIPHGWDHSALAPGAENRPIAAVRPGPDGPLFYDLHDLQELPDPRIPLDGAQHIGDDLDQALPDLLRRALGLLSLDGANAAA